MSDERARLVPLHNGEKAFSPFSEAEMQRRQDALRAWMADKQVDACILTSYHCVNYYGGFVYCAFGRKYALVIDQEKVTAVSATIDGGHPHRRSFGETISYTDWRKDNFFHAIGTLLPKVRKVGIEFDHVDVDMRRHIEGAIPAVRLIDCAKPSMKMRMIKSEEEIALIRTGAEVADIGGAAVVEAIAAGVPEYEVALTGTAAMTRAIAQRFPEVELMDTWTWFQSGINTDGAHNPVTNRKIEAGDILSLTCSPVIFGYSAALKRTLFCEHCPDAALDLWEKNVKAHERGLALMQPGARCKDIAEELNEMYREWDLLQYRNAGFGHSFGILSHYYGREAALELREDIATELEPGMVISMSPMIMIPEGQEGAGGYREQDILLLTDDGAETITRFPCGAEHNIIPAKPASS